MLEEWKNVRKVIGAKQLRRALMEGGVRQVCLARDADPAITEPLAALCGERQVPCQWIDRMSDLGRVCGIDVQASAAGILNAF